VARLALTRPVSESIARCQLTFQRREQIDIGLAREQHAAYEQALAESGCTVERLPAADDLPDAVFVEDTAVVLDEIAIITRPGAEARRPEVGVVARRLAELGPVCAIDAPATVDGGDVLRAGRLLYVGLTSRTNQAGHRALARIAGPLGYAVIPVPVGACLHLKSAASWLGDDRILIDATRLPEAVFAGLEVLVVPPGEAAAANVLALGDSVLIADGFPRTRALLEGMGASCRTVANSELAKAEGGLTCCSLILENSVARHEPTRRSPIPEGREI